MDTNDTRLLDRLHNLETRITVLEGWKVSLKGDIESLAKHSIEVDEKCSEIQVYLDERKSVRDRQATLLQDIKKWLAILIAGWLLLVFLDGAKISVLEWLQPSLSGQRAR
jgi:hypothetical protein